MSPEILAAIITGLVGLASLVSGAFFTYLGYRERRDNALREAVFRELALFGGGVQKRNIGLSMIGHFWGQMPELEGLFVRLLTNQGIYIVAKDEPVEPHEFSNMERIIRLLESVPKIKSEYDPFYDELIEELKKRNKEGRSGSRMTAEVLDDWIGRLEFRKKR
ncbi:MAG TPA: hypothetical protein VJ183_01310 [Chloroflexia bacterium]|nr:hypothetical protein [Chloroflexia bacterium]